MNFFNSCDSPEKLFRDVPEFAPKVSLEDGIARVLEAMEREDRIPAAEAGGWEDAIIEQQKRAFRGQALLSSTLE